ncbi:MAG: hypothetical protein SGI74_12085 [Oligoflexia bacterium]|nr:hypothetical protein [Oligoflexia bacterium]
MNFQSPGEIRLTMIMFISLMAAALLFTVNANAYIPTSHFIFDRTAAQHGKSAYSIEQEVIFSEGIERLTVKENWLVVDGGEMRVQAYGDNFRVIKLLKRGRNYWVDQDSSERGGEVSPDFFMSPLLTRSAMDLKKHFNKWGIIPAEALREKRISKDLKEIKVETENFVRLGRVSGAVTYTYGKLTPVNSPATPGLWIEQDAFVIRKMRSPSGAEFFGNNYLAYLKNLWFPRNQTITFDNHTVEVRVTRVQSIDLNTEQKRQFDSNWFRNRPDVATMWPKSSLAPVVQEFYKRFR